MAHQEFLYNRLVLNYRGNTAFLLFSCVCTSINKVVGCSCETTHYDLVSFLPAVNIRTVILLTMLDFIDSMIDDLISHMS